MIRVDWGDFDAPRGPNHEVCQRSGVLLQVGMGRVTRDPHDEKRVAYVITKKMAHDHGPRKDGETIILMVELSRIAVKGVNIPFEVSSGD